MDHIDILNAIGDHCDDLTRFNLCCSDVNYWQSQKKHLAEKETELYDKRISKLVKQFPPDRITRVKHMDKIFRCSIEFDHIIHSNVRSMLLKKLTESRKAGLSHRKYMYYLTFFDKQIKAICE